MTPVLVDTSVWVVLFRRAAHPAGDRLADLLKEGMACANGLIRAELLSGTRSEEEFGRFAGLFSAVPLLSDPPDLWERLARARFHLARKGVQAAVADLIVALAAEHHDVPLLTLDRDFAQIQKVLHVSFHPLSASE